MSKILLLADAGSTTGFARVTHALGDRLVSQYGHEIHCLATNFDGDAGAIDTPMKLWRPNILQPDDIFGASRYVELIARLMPDLIIIMNDPYMVLRAIFRNKWDTDLILGRTRPIIAYMPVDGTHQPSYWARLPEFVSKLAALPGSTDPMFVPIAMSKFGAKFLETDDVIYHGVEPEFRPVTEDDPIVTTAGEVITDKASAKVAFGFDPDQFLVLRVDRNSHRKNFGDTWRALVPVMKRHKNMVAWFHCRAEGDSLEIPQLLNRDPETSDRFFYPGLYSTVHGWPNQDLVALYNAADLFVSTSMGEGFGLTLAEAAACGVPIIAQKVSSIPEVVGPGGFLIPPERLMAVDSGEDQWLPDVKGFTNAIERLYSDRGLRESLGAAGRAHVLEKFNWDDKAAQMNEVITRVAQKVSEMPIRGGEQDAEPDPEPEPVGV